ncbi:MAG TPA: hypothetical protein VK081_09465 [Planctomycetota bacterium]|nr:hypothetical protein [Planctomycetota bacterium]
MAYLRVGEFLDRVRAIHRAFQRHYRQSAYWQSDDRLRMLLERMATQEKALASTAEHWGSAADATVRETWMQYVPLERVAEVLEDTEVDPNEDIERVIAKATAFDAAIVEAYRALASSMLPPRVRDVFESLAQMEENKGKQRSMSAEELYEPTPGQEDEDG